MRRVCFDSRPRGRFIIEGEKYAEIECWRGRPEVAVLRYCRPDEARQARVAPRVLTQRKNVDPGEKRDPVDEVPILSQSIFKWEALSKRNVVE
jgi:hypothetical protein